ncbi:ABC transporter ATP-binding protein [Candidatus Albibeggiatoa sp. nov. BB20]|uniref:ABC transporter ATP-binding protein n=1 Tax=Candidatus Albibeggiatoa sp. nov. BB20 TaxID=3162723 RepID=UPI0033658B44
MAAISIQQVHKHYKQLHALKGINFDIPEGSFFGLLGPNGAGKSTLINIMAGLAKATTGSISIKGHDVRKQWRQARQAMGVVPQELVYDPFFTIKELLRLQSGYFGLGRENEVWLDELLEILSLTDKANTNMFELSGGMKRRVLIGQALVHKPPVVVLDEPTAGVDIELRKMLWDFATQLHDKGHTIVLTTHYLEEAESLCDRIAILNDGEVVALDDKQALLARYPFRLLCLSLENHADIPAQLQDKVQSFEGNQLVLRLHRDHDTVNDVLESLRSAQINFVDLHTQEPGLEEVFISLTHKEVNS